MENLCITIYASVGFEVEEGVRQCGLNKSKAWQIKSQLESSQKKTRKLSAKETEFNYLQVDKLRFRLDTTVCRDNPEEIEV